MAKIVIAGRSDCPYFAKVELLGDRLAKNLPSLKLHKIVKTPDDWQNFLNLTNHEQGWEHSTSPIIWRELIDRGGKGVLIGNASDFQEYVKGYYGLESSLTSEDMKIIGKENFETKQAVDAEEAAYKALSQPLNVCITAADSPVCYALLSALTSGDCFGPGLEIALRLMGSPGCDDKQLEGLAAEAMDMCNGLLRSIEIANHPLDAFKGCDVIVILNEIIRQEEETYEDWIKRNHDFFVEYAKVINEVALKNSRILVAGRGPINFNTMFMIRNAPKIPRQNFAAVSRAVENRAKAVIAQRLNVNTAGVVDLIVWGNTNGQTFIDTSKARVHGYDGAIWGPSSYSRSVQEMVHDNKWLEKEYLELVHSRLSTIETGIGHQAAGSAARSITSVLHHWWNGSPLGQMFSLAVCSEGWYDVPEGFVISYPVTLSPKGFWTVVQDIELSEEAKKQIELTIQDLKKEYEVIYPPPKPPTPSPPPAEEITLQDGPEVNVTSDDAPNENATQEGKLPGTADATGESQPENKPENPEESPDKADAEPELEQEPEQ